MAFGVLVFVVGTLLVANAWAVVDAKFAVAAAAREATRAYVETPPGEDPLVRAEAAGRASIADSGRRPERLALQLLEGAFVRCRTVRFEARYPVPSVLLPWLGASDGFSAAARHGELVDPFRSGVPGESVGCDGPAR